MNNIRAIRSMSYAGKMAGAIFGAACATEAVFAGSQMLLNDMSVLGNTAKEIVNPTIYKAKTGRFKRSINVRHSRIPGDNSYIKVSGDVSPVNSKPIRINKSQIK